MKRLNTLQPHSLEASSMKRILPISCVIAALAVTQVVHADLTVAQPKKQVQPAKTSQVVKSRTPAKTNTEVAVKVSKLDKALSRALKAAAEGKSRSIDASSWKRNGLAKETGRDYHDFKTQQARVNALDRLAWERAGAEQITGREYGELMGDIARLKELVRAGRASGLPLGDTSFKRGKGFPKTPDVCDTPDPNEKPGATPEPYPNIGDCSVPGEPKTKVDPPSTDIETGGGDTAPGGTEGDADSTGEGDPDSTGEGDTDDSDSSSGIVGPQGPGGPLPGPINSMTSDQATSALRMQLSNMLVGQK